MPEPSPYPTPQPTNLELTILRTLWNLGPSTVRQVQSALGGDAATGYTTVLKMLQIMTGKGLVERDASTRTHVYQAVASQQTTQRQLVRDLLKRAFGGSIQQFVLQALSSEQATPADLREIRRLLDRMEKEGK